MTLTEIYTNLLNNNIKVATEGLKKYLKINNKEEYKFLILKLLKINILENDTAFIKTMVTISDIINNTFTFNIDKYINLFHEAVDNNNYEIAKTYFELLVQTETLGFKIHKLHTLNKKLMSIKPKKIRENYYGISTTKVKKISKLLQSGVSLENACAITNERLHTYIRLALIFAKEFYYYEDYTNGDIFLEKALVELEKSQSADTTLIEEILNSKYTYRNYKDNHKSLLIYGYKRNNTN